MKKNLPVSVQSIRLAALSITAEPGDTVPERKPLDDRSGLILFGKQHTLAVELLVANENYLSGHDYGSLKRMLRIAVHDVTDRRILTCVTVSVDLEEDSDGCRIYQELPLQKAVIDSGHDYRVRVSDVSSRIAFAEKEFYFMDLTKIRVLPTGWFRPLRAYMSEKRFGRKFCGIDAPADSYCYVNFDLERLLPDNCRIPELSIRLTFDDSCSREEYIYPEIIEDNDSPAGVIYRASTRFFVSSKTKGIVYAELKAMGYTFAAASFSTDGPDVEGEWQGDELRKLPTEDLQWIEDSIILMLKAKRQGDVIPFKDADDKFAEFLRENIPHRRMTDTAADNESESEEDEDDFAEPEL